jgi:sigma-B regulation protein RsbU (phosphoserine phosphatase)
MNFAIPPVQDSQSSSQIDKGIALLDELMKKSYELADKNKSVLPGEAYMEMRNMNSEMLQLSRSLKNWKQEQSDNNALMEVSQVINSSLEMNALLQLVMDIIIRLTGAERGFLMLLNEQGVPEIRIARNWGKESLEQNETTVSKSLVGKVLETGEPILTDNATVDDRFGQQNSVIMHNLRSIVCVPLKLREKIIGVMYADNRFQAGIFTQSHVRTLSTFANQAAIAIENAQLFESLKKLAKIEQEMEIARRIQVDFLPSVMPTLEGWEIDASFCPARDVAGDFFDVFYLSPEHLCIVIADVCDKGVGAALFMALIRSLVRAFSDLGLLQSRMTLSGNMENSKLRKSNRQLTSLITEITALNAVILSNNYLIQNHSNTNMFATLFLGVLDLETGKLIYINAGHNPPYLVGKDGIKEKFKATGPAVGMVPEANYSIRESVLEPGDFLYTFTDGVTEARSKTGELFSEARLLPLLTMPTSSPHQLLERVNEGITKHTDGFEQSDDITMLAVHHLLKS